MIFVIFGKHTSSFVVCMLTNSQVKNFFSQYASMVNNALFSDPIDARGLCQAFAEHFIGADPNGILAGHNDDRFEAAIRDGIISYRNIGVRSMMIMSQEVQVLDDMHALVKIQWRCVYELGARNGEITFANYYLVRSENKDVIKIFSYVTGDENKAFRENGLL